MHFLLSPFTWVLLAALGFLLAPCLRRRRFVLTLASALALAGVLGAMPLGANLLVAPLENRVPENANCAAHAHATIVVLAGGSDRAARNLDDFAALTLASLRRTLAAVALWRSEPDATLVIAGGPAFFGAPADSALMRGFAITLAVPPQAIRIETTSANTWENAQSVAKLLPPGPVTLVTSAMHMPRAEFALEHAGFTVCPFPTDRRFVAFGLPGYLLPQAGAAIKTEQALHEWVGLVYYHWLAWRGRADAKPPVHA
ncbi:MAG: YdcF family protein [Proteobacteria bacterium]|nr:YdcF family protein [Pseudomonadota bacterium]